jgi:hypothetical protein
MTARGCLFGINLPWLDGAYGHDLAPNERRPTWPCDFSPLRSYRPLIEARDLGFDAVRIWLCENAEGIVTEGGKPDRPHPRLLEGIAVLQECAALVGVRIYWTLLDGNAWRREGDALTHAVLSDPDTCARFADRVAAPIAARLDPAVTFAVEVVNEPESLCPTCVTPASEGVPWEVLARSIHRIADAVHAARPHRIPVTAGTLHTYLPELFACDPGLDALDVHVYHTSAGLPSREDLASAVGDRRLIDEKMPLIAGECGVPDGAPPEALSALKNYVYNAQRNGYDAAFLWRLETILVDARDPDRHHTELGSHIQAILGQVKGSTPAWPAR